MIKRTNKILAALVLSTLLIQNLSAQKKPAKTVERLAAAATPPHYGLESTEGNEITPARFSRLTDLGNGFWCAEENGKSGVIDKTGAWVIQPVFKSILQYRDGKVVASEFVSTLDKRFNEENFSALYDLTMDSITVFGVADAKGKWTIPAAYRYLEIGDGETYLFLAGRGDYGYLNATGGVMIEPKFEYATVFHGNVAITSAGGIRGQSYDRDYLFSRRYSLYSGGTWTIIGKDGNAVSTTTYDYIREFSNGRAAFNKGGTWRRKNYSDQFILSGGLWGYIDENGTEIIPAKFSFAYDFVNGKARVRDDKNLTWINTNGDTTSAGQIREESEVRIHCTGSRYGYIDENGNWKIMPAFFGAGRFSEGLAAVQPALEADNHCRNQTMSEEEYSDLDWGDGRFRDYDEVMLDISEIVDNVGGESGYHRRYWGYTDVSGKLVIPAKFDYAMPFSNGRAYVCYRDKWGIIDREGKWVFAPVMDLPWQLGSVDNYITGRVTNNQLPWFWSSGDSERQRENLFSFSEGIGVIFYQQKYGYIDTTGKIVAAPVYDAAMLFHKGRGAVSHNTNWGFVDKTGKEVIALKYRTVYSFTDNGLACFAQESTAPASEDGADEVVVDVSDQNPDYYEYRENVYGYLDTLGVVVIPARFRYADSFYEGLAKVTDKSNLVGYIDATGKYVIQPKFRSGSNFAYGYAMVTYGYEQAHFIGRNGVDAPQYTYKKPPPYEKTLEVSIEKGELFGYRIQGGEYIIAPQFTSAFPFYPVR